MAQIQRPVLKLLENLYRFVSSQDGAPTEFELGLGISAVHDVGRMAEIGAARINRDSAGYWIASIRQVHTVTGSLTDDLNFTNPGSAGEAYSIDERREWIWLMADWLSANDGTDFGESTLFINVITNDFFIGPAEGVPASVRQPFARYTSVDGTSGQGIRDATTTDIYPALVLSPQDGIRMVSVSDTAGTVTITQNILFWQGLRNTFPPGFA